MKGVLFLLILVVIMWYGLLPYLLMVLVNSIFDINLAFWQVFLIWYFILIITNRFGVKVSGD